LDLENVLEVYEKINYLIDEKKITKKEFVVKLLALEPKLRATGEVPSEQTIYRYLNAQRELKIELISYIAEVLEVDEQEFFRFDIEYATEYNFRYSKDAREILDLLQYAPANMIEHIRTTLKGYKNHYEDGVKRIY
jgi:transcriptional regulator with XRE-family HTH domain